MTTVQSSRFMVGTALGKSFEVAFANITPFGIMALLMTLPILVSDYFAYDAMFESQRVLFDPELANDPAALQTLEEYAWQQWLYNGLNMILYGMAWAFCTATMSFGTYEALRGRRPSIDECLKRGLPLVVPALAIGILLLLALMLASIALVIPAAILAMVWYVVIPVAVVERPGIFATFGRSAELTRGNRWRIFGISLIAWAIGVGLSIPIFIVIFLFYGNAMILAGFAWVTTAASLIFSAVLTAVVYYYLRIAREGGSIEDIAAVFD